MQETSTFTIYNASAGSGKTYTLVKEYLSLLFQNKKNDSYRSILAVTFTNKAVAEMKSRIIDAIFAFSQPECPPKYKDLMQSLSTETNLEEEELKEKSRKILRNIIHNYAGFEVSTIDGFTHRVLRTFAKDLGLPLNFEVELNTSDIIQEAVERVLNKAGQDKQLTTVLIDFALTKTDDDKSWDIARDLFKIGELLNSENHQPFLELLKGRDLADFSKLGKNLKAEKQALEEIIKKRGNSFFQILEENGLENKHFNRGSCPNFFGKLQKGNFQVDFDAKWQSCLADDPLYANKVDEDKKPILDKIQPLIVQLYEEVKQDLTQLQFLVAVQKNLTPLSLLSSIQNEIEGITQERSLVLISDFNATIGKAVKDQPAPFVYERLGERYRHYFIDEFQDTSQLQWENLIPLLDHTLSGGHQEGENGSLTLVGDAKQSIYRWRGGKAEQFMDLCEKGNPFNIENKKVVLLPDNHRSARNIVTFNNDFFKFSSTWFSSIDHQNLFETTNNQNPVKSSEGYVSISFIEAENVAEEMEIYPERVLEIIRELEEKDIPKSNICILTRRKKEGVAIANHLSEHQVPVVSAESLLIARSPEVAFLVAVLQFSVDGTEKTLKLQLLRFLLEHHVDVIEQYEFIQERLELDGQQFFDSLRQYNIEFDLRHITNFSVYEAVEYSIRCFGLVQGSDAYVQFFLDFVYEVSQKEGSGIFDFLALWEQKKENLSIAASQDEDAVQIMTIHKAKGLEFPVVIFPFANSSITDVARESLWMSLPESLTGEIPVGYLKATKEMLHWDNTAALQYEDLCSYSQLDALNVLYVALTRASQQLYVVSKMELDRKGNENMNKFSGLFISYLKSIDRWDESFKYEFGRPDGFISAEKNVAASLQQKEFFSSPTEGAGISLITRSGLLWDSAQQKAIERGQLIHDIFAVIDTYNDVEIAMYRAREDGLFDFSTTAEIKKLIEEVVHHDDLKEYFSGAGINHNERNIITGHGNILRPDRLNFMGNGVTIIDYKTGDLNPSHENQLNSYAEILSEMGYNIAKKILVYINEKVSLVFV